ncbi:hypothetical protein [Streptomyces indicus]|uniref:Uncharacterized protein n=1 Tax=Streptomyces indicus TaxID=417292 RepID=A0A1G9CAP4_9ACTN|nr:hypothetical protein [Streptomyces indicus]SDK48729.1 hypothetical protein SAMN05421806_10833 [Streptomyces indicus]
MTLEPDTGHTPPSAPPAWIPTSCTLPTEARPLRLAEWDALFSTHLRSLTHPDPCHLRLTLKPAPEAEAFSELAHHVRDLTDHEAACCSFFTFTVTTELAAKAVHLEVAVDEPHAPVLTALRHRAAAAAPGLLSTARETQPSHRPDS